MTKASIKHWITALRLRTLPLALASIFTGAAISGQNTPHFGWTLALIVLTTVLLQILSNLANDYGDSINGSDNEGRIGPMRAVQSGVISAERMLKAVVFTAVLAFVSGSTLLYLCFIARGLFIEFAIFLTLGLLAIIAAIRYTAGKNPYGYRGLGDLSVMLFFGLVGVCGTAYLLSESFAFTAILPALAMGSFATAVLNLNNLRDHENDARTGKRTLVVALGYQNAKRYHITLFTFGWLALSIWLLLMAENRLMLAALAVIPMHISHLKKVEKTTQPLFLDPELKKVALSAFVISLWLFTASFIQ